MKSFENGFIENQSVSHRLVLAVGAIREFKGKEALFKQQQPQVLETLRQAAVIQSTESSNRIEGITAPLGRIKDLVANKTTPQNRSEQEIAGYRDVLDTIHNNHAHIRVSSNMMLQLHRDMYKYLPSDGGHWKITDNQITEIHPDGSRVVRFEPVPAYLTQDAMAQLHQGFDRAWQTHAVDPLILIPAYVLDFLCIHPFMDGNGRMARLLSLLLLYHAGYEVGRYISLEKLIEGSRESYYDALQKSSVGWHEGEHDLLPWTEYFLGIVTVAYQQLQDMAGSMLTARGSKSEMVLQAIQAFMSDFSVKELQDACPHVSIDMIRRILKDEKASGRLESLGRGPQARWKKI